MGTSDMNPRRAITHGVREIMGVRIPQGTIIEEYDPVTDEWVYLYCVHPDDAHYLLK